MTRIHLQVSMSNHDQDEMDCKMDKLENERLRFVLNFAKLVLDHKCLWEVQTWSYPIILYFKMQQHWAKPGKISGLSLRLYVTDNTYQHLIIKPFVA